MTCTFTLSCCLSYLFIYVFIYIFIYLFIHSLIYPLFVYLQPYVLDFVQLIYYMYFTLIMCMLLSATCTHFKWELMLYCLLCPTSNTFFTLTLSLTSRHENILHHWLFVMILRTRGQWCEDLIWFCRYYGQAVEQKVLSYWWIRHYAHMTSL